MSMLEQSYYTTRHSKRTANKSKPRSKISDH